MNHFFLWVGLRAGVIPSEDHKLLSHYKSVEKVLSAAGNNWRITYAIQQGGLGAFSDDRRRILTTHYGKRHLFWFGHAWSKSDGPQPSITLLGKNADKLSNVDLVKVARDNSFGVFALLLIDESSGEIIVAADSLGSFHVYQRKFQSGIAISNSSAMLAGLLPHASLDPVGIQELCSNAVANEDRTIWADVKKLRGGQILKIHAQNSQVELIGHRPLLTELNDIHGYAANPVPALFDAVSDVLQTIDGIGGRGPEFRQLPWIADLTGGNDSRALMAAIVANHINVASTVSGPSTDPDVQIGEHLAKQLGILHFTRPPQNPITTAQFFDALSLTDGEFDIIEYSDVAAIHRHHIRDGLQFSLNGTYGELGRGHAWRMGLPGMLFPNVMAEKLQRREPLMLKHPSVARWGQNFSLKNPTMLFSKDANSACVDYFPGMFERLMTYVGHLPQHAQLDLIHVDLRQERWYGRLASCTNQIWPAIAPWGFQGPLTKVLTSNPTCRRNGLLTRAFTFSYAPLLAMEPLYTGNPAMPFSLKQAHRFLPVVPFFANRALQKALSRFHLNKHDEAPTARARQPLLCSDPEVREWLTSPSLADSGLFNKDLLIRLLSPDQPQSVRMHRLWCRLLTLEAALRHQAATRTL